MINTRDLLSFMLIFFFAAGLFLVSISTEFNAKAQKNQREFKEAAPFNTEYSQLSIFKMENLRKERDCVVCGARTVFVNKETGNHVCSEECRYKDNGRKDESVYSAE